MAEEIVACPSCSKKFRIPEGAPPGSFACTACGADVPYGQAAARPAARPAGRPASATSRAAPSRAAPSRAAPSRAGPSRTASATHAAPARARARHAREELDEGPPKKNLAWLWWTGGIAVGAIIIVLVFNATKPPPPPVVPPPVTPTSPKPAETPKPATPEAAKTEPGKPAAPEAAKPETAKPSDPAAAKPSDPAAATPEEKPPEAPKRATTIASLGQTVASVPGTTDEERNDMERMLATVLDRDAGNEASVAESKIRGMGKKAIPVLLSVFSKQFQAGKWGNEADQWGAEKVQDILHMIVRADRPRNDFTAKFTPGGLSPPEDFEKAARMWVDWWNVTGQLKEKFRKGDEDTANPK